MKNHQCNYNSFRSAAPPTGSLTCELVYSVDHKIFPLYLSIRRLRFERILFVPVKSFPEFSFAKMNVEQGSGHVDAPTIATENSKWMGNFVHLYREFCESLCIANTAFSPSCARRRRKTRTHAITFSSLAYFAFNPISNCSKFIEMQRLCDDYWAQINSSLLHPFRLLQTKFKLILIDRRFQFALLVV